LTKVAKNKASRIEKIIEKATVDAYSEDEQACGLFSALEENVTVPQECLAGKNKVTLKKIVMNGNSAFARILTASKENYLVPIGTVRLKKAKEQDFIDAYAEWQG
jgi:hypothetical protein